MTLAAGAGSLLRSARVFSEVLGLPPHTFPPAHISSRLPSNLGCKQVIHKQAYIDLHVHIRAYIYMCMGGNALQAIVQVLSLPIPGVE